MNKFFQKHPDLILTSLTVIFLVLIIGSYFWGVTLLVGNLNSAINPSKSVSANTGFDIPGAKNLNLKGLVTQ